MMVINFLTSRVVRMITFANQTFCFCGYTASGFTLQHPPLPDSKVWRCEKFEPGLIAACETSQLLNLKLPQFPPFIIRATTHSAVFSSNGPGIIQGCMWRYYHKKAPPSNCTYLTSDLPFVPPRQQIAVSVMAGPSELDRSCPRSGAISVGGYLSINLFNAKVNSHTPSRCTTPPQPLLCKKTHTLTHAPTLSTRQAGGLRLSSLSLPPCSCLHPLFLSEF